MGPTQDKKKIASGLYLVKAAAASSVVVNNPGEPQVINDHPDLLLSSWIQYLLVTTFEVAAFFNFWTNMLFLSKFCLTLFMFK